MSAVQMRGKRGRPRKSSHPVNSADVSDSQLLKDLHAIEMDVLRLPSPFAKHFIKFTSSELSVLALELAHEMAAFTALEKLASRTPALTAQGGPRTGPRPKSAQAVLVAQISQVLAVRGVSLPAWKNARRECTDLIDFCGLLARATKTRRLTITRRTLAKAPKKGFQALPVGAD